MPLRHPYINKIQLARNTMIHKKIKLRKNIELTDALKEFDKPMTLWASFNFSTKYIYIHTHTVNLLQILL